MAAKRWEYWIAVDRSELAALGQEGWELVSVVVSGGEETFYMKRPSPSIREEITAAQRDQALGLAEGGAGE